MLRFLFKVGIFVFMGVTTLLDGSYAGTGALGIAG